MNRTSDKLQEELLHSELSSIEDDDKEGVSILAIWHFPTFRLRAIMLLFASYVVKYDIYAIYSMFMRQTIYAIL